MAGREGRSCRKPAPYVLTPTSLRFHEVSNQNLQNTHIGSQDSMRKNVMVSLGTKLHHHGMYPCRTPYGKTVPILIFVVDANNESLSISTLLISSFKLMKVPCVSTAPSVILMHADKSCLILILSSSHPRGNYTCGEDDFEVQPSHWAYRAPLDQRTRCCTSNHLSI